MQCTSPLVLCVGVTLAVVVWSVQHTEAQPYRAKRVSDQRLAELETLLVLAKMNREMHLHMPLGYGVADPTKLGRRKRTSSSSSWDSPPQDGILLGSSDLEPPLALRPPATVEDDVFSIGERLNTMVV